MDYLNASQSGRLRQLQIRLGAIFALNLLFSKMTFPTINYER
jgi:hypothetical protein